MTHQNTRLAALLAAISLLGAGCAQPAPRPQAVHETAPSAQELSTSDSFDSPLLTPASQPTLSLEAFAQQQFTGSDLQLGKTLESNAVYAKKYITYRSNGLLISGTFSIPHGKGPFPLVVLAHGYIDPKIYTNGRGLRREQDYLARKGYAVLHTDYRGHAESENDGNSEVRLRFGYAEDAINAVLAVRAAKLPNVDGSRAAMLGHSMGGGVTMRTLVAQPDLLKAAVLFAPVSGDERDNFNKWTKSRPETAAEIVAKYGAPDEAPAFWDGVSPIMHIGKMKTPVLLHHGTADESCSIEWARRLDAAAKTAGKTDFTFHEYPGQPHEFTTAWPQVMQRTAAFFDEHLKTTAE